MAKSTTIKPEILEALKNVYLSFGEAYEALKNHEKLQQEVAKLKATVKSQEQKIGDLLTQLKGYETLTANRVVVCPECLGSGAYILNGEVEECDKCDSKGWIEK